MRCSTQPLAFSCTVTVTHYWQNARPGQHLLLCCPSVPGVTAAGRLCNVLFTSSQTVRGSHIQFTVATKQQWLLDHKYLRKSLSIPGHTIKGDAKQIASSGKDRVWTAQSVTNSIQLYAGCVHHNKGCCKSLLNSYSLPEGWNQFTVAHQWMEKINLFFFRLLNPPMPLRKVAICNRNGSCLILGS